jgi:hypothetical protein
MKSNIFTVIVVLKSIFSIVAAILVVMLKIITDTLWNVSSRVVYCDFPFLNTL